MGYACNSEIGNTFRINSGDFRVQDWLLDSPLSAGAKLTFTVLATCARGKDYVWPGIDYLAQKVSASNKTITRHINELVNFGLLRKQRMQFKGQVRNVYFFVQHQIVKLYPNQLAPQSDKTTDCPDPSQVKKADDPTICPKQPAKMSDPNNMNSENTEGKEETNPPLPPFEPDSASAAVTAVEEGGEEIFSEGKEENQFVRFSESFDGYDPAMKQVKEELIALAEKILPDIWSHAVKSSIVEEGDDGKVLIRLHNDFTKSFMKSNFPQFFSDTETLMREMGYNNYSFAVFTPDQTDRCLAEDREIQKRKEALEAEKKRKAKAEADAKITNLDLLPVEQRFEILFKHYDLDKRKRKARNIFLELDRKGELPSMKTMMDSITDHAQNDYWWINRTRPLFLTWLEDHCWEDKPYAK